MDPELADPRPDIQWTTAHLPQFVPATASVPARGVSKRCAELAMTCSDLTGELLTAVSLPRHGRHAVYAIAVRRGLDGLDGTTARRARLRRAAVRLVSAARARVARAAR